MDGTLVSCDLFMDFLRANCQRIVWLVTCISMRFFADFSVFGRERLLNLQRPLLIISNHRTYWDSMIIGTLFPLFSGGYLPIGFMADDIYFQSISFRVFFWLTGVFPNRRKVGLDMSLGYPREVLIKRKGAFLIFPWGRRIYLDEDHGLPARGAAVLAKEIPDLTILPIFLDTSVGVTPFDFIKGKKKIMKVIVGEFFQLMPEEREEGDDRVSKKFAEAIFALHRS